jgi:hypothetical protein
METFVLRLKAHQDFQGNPKAPCSKRKQQLDSMNSPNFGEISGVYQSGLPCLKGGNPQEGPI